MKKSAYIEVGDKPWCEWTATQAGRDIADKCGGPVCGHGTISKATFAARQLRPHFRKGAVRVVVGTCPKFTEIMEGQ